MKPTSVQRIRFERALCATGALVCYTAAALLAPSGARSQLAPLAVVSPTAERVDETPIETVPPARDAFAPRIADVAEAAPQTLRLLPSPPPLTARPTGLAPRVESAARVTAIVTGDAPSAIVEVDGAPQAVGVGDRIAGARIVAIEASAIVLDNGTRLHLAAVTP